MPDSEIDALFPKVKRARITITLKSGLQYSAQTDVTKGDPEDPLSDEEIIAKFRANTDSILSHECIDEIINATREMESLGDISRYMSLFII